MFILTAIPSTFSRLSLRVPRPSACPCRRAVVWCRCRCSFAVVIVVVVVGRRLGCCRRCFVFVAGGGGGGVAAVAVVVALVCGCVVRVAVVVVVAVILAGVGLPLSSCLSLVPSLLFLLWSFFVVVLVCCSHAPFVGRLLFLVCDRLLSLVASSVTAPQRIVCCMLCVELCAICNTK